MPLKCFTGLRILMASRRATADLDAGTFAQRREAPQSPQGEEPHSMGSASVAPEEARGAVAEAAPEPVQLPVPRHIGNSQDHATDQLRRAQTAIPCQSRLSPADLESCKQLSMSICAGVRNTFSGTFENSLDLSLGQVLSSVPRPLTSLVPEADVELMRQMYLRMVENDPDDILQELALPLQQEFALESGSNNVQPLTLVVDNGSLMRVHKEAMSVGRLDSCDIQISEHLREVSRIHCWIFNLQAGVLVVDGWSLAGTCLVDSTSPGEESSKPDRRVLLIPQGEAATIKLGQVEVTVNPKLCMMCEEHPRSVRLACGHQAFCAPCVERLQEVDNGRYSCPLCRAPGNNVYYSPIRAGIHTLVQLPGVR